jgi:ligand-binding sensor domain-containing protein
VYQGGQWRVLSRPGEPEGYQIGQILPDPEGRPWVLPEYGGQPSVVDPATGQASRPPQWPPAAPDVLSLAFSGGATWAGTSSGLLRLEDGALKALTEADGLPDNRVGALLATTDTLWIGTSAGLASLDTDTGKVTGTVDALNGQYVDALALDRDGAVWAGTHWGEGDASSAVYRIAGSEHQVWPNDGPPLNGTGHSVKSLATAEDGTVWVGSNGGVYRWDGQKWQGWDASQGAPAGDIFAMLAHDGAMWIAGHSKEISRWEPERGWQHFRPKGLTADVLDMYVGDDGVLWLATGDGLLRYAPG